MGPFTLHGVLQDMEPVSFPSNNLNSKSCGASGAEIESNLFF